MQNYLAGLDKDILKMIRQIGRMADSQGLKAYIVGGIVRDIILHRKNFDLDIVIEGNCLEFASTVAKGVGARLTRYEQFKTASLQLSSDARIDLATARSEFYAHSGALPRVKEGSLKDDLFRRDFTINALAICVNRNKFGQLIDQCNGLEDLRQGRVRILHDQSFVDDPTRILRSVRFEQRFGFETEENTLSLLKQALKNNLTKNVKPPRYFAEFKKILAEPEPLKCVKRLDQLGGLKFIAPGLKIEYNALRHLERQLGKKDLGLPSGVEKWLLYFMAVVQNVSPHVLGKILVQFHLRKEEREAALVICRGTELKKKISSPKLSRSQVCRILRPLPLSAVLYLWFDALRLLTTGLERRTTLSERSESKGYHERRGGWMFSHLKHFLNKDRDIRLAIDGNDLKRFGLESGPEIGRILDQVLDEKIDGKVSSKKEELNLAKELILCHA